jgi:hypothetical protein
MRIAPRLAASALLLLCLTAPCLAPQAAGRPDLSPGLSPDQVRARLGPPARVARQVFAYRCLEQWSYTQPQPLRLVFDCPRGRKPRLQSVHRVRPAQAP